MKSEKILEGQDRGKKSLRYSCSRSIPLFSLPNSEKSRKMWDTHDEGCQSDIVCFVIFSEIFKKEVDKRLQVSNYVVK